MSRKLLSDPNVRTAYVATKLVVFCLAAAATWPLSRIIGAKAWYGLAIFAAVLAVMTAIVLAAGSKEQAPEAETETELEPEEETDPDEPFEIELGDSIDLHSFPPKDMPDVVDAYLESVGGKGFSEVRLIHGRGIGVQRDRVQKLLARHPLVSGFHDAPPERGGWGATIAYLKNSLSADDT